MRLLVMVLLAASAVVAFRFIAIGTWMLLGFDGLPEEFEDWMLAFMAGLLMAVVTGAAIFMLWGLAGAIT